MVIGSGLCGTHVESKSHERTMKNADKKSNEEQNFVAIFQNDEVVSHEGKFFKFVVNKADLRRLANICRQISVTRTLL